MKSFSQRLLPLEVHRVGQSNRFAKQNPSVMPGNRVETTGSFDGFSALCERSPGHKKAHEAEANYRDKKPC